MTILNKFYSTLIEAAQLGRAEELNLPRVDAGPGTFQNILNLVFVIAGAAALGFIVWGGFRYVVSSGNPEDTKTAKDTIVYAIVGLVVTLLAFTAVNFIIGGFRN